MGENVKYYSKPLKQLVSDGHEIGNHTYSHTVLNKLSYSQIQKEIKDTEKQLGTVCEYKPKLIRPPCGFCNDSLVKLAREEDNKIVLWSIDTHDWANASADSIVKNVLRNIQGGDIILFHDFISYGGNTVEAIDILIPLLQKEGYKFVTVSELLQ